MSRVVPNDRSLSDEDRRYLLERGQESQISYLDQQFPPDPDALARFEAELRGELPEAFTGDTALKDSLQARVAQLEAYITDELGEDLPPAPGEEVSEEDTRPYTEWLASELSDEAASRGLSKSGSKAELVARLEENDAATTAPPV